MHLRKARRKGKFNSKVAFENKLAKLNTPQTTKVQISRKKGKFTAEKVTLREIALNNKILRLHLVRENLKGNFYITTYKLEDLVEAEENCSCNKT